jgi:hypothetical protein
LAADAWPLDCTAQASIGRRGGKAVEFAEVNEALQDVLFTGSRLNVKLLGGPLATNDGSLARHPAISPAKASVDLAQP